MFKENIKQKIKLKKKMIRILKKEVLISCLFLLVSCKEEKVKTVVNNKLEKQVYKDKNTEYYIDFPDTVSVNKKYYGKIIFKNALDTITKSMDYDVKSKKNRYIIFSMTTVDKINYPEKHLWKIAKDTFGAIDCNTIPFFDVKFNKKGEFYIDGVINDQGYITSSKKNINGDYDTRIITNEFRATKKVVVVDTSPIRRVNLSQNQ